MSSRHGTGVIMAAEPGTESSEASEVCGRIEDLLDEGEPDEALVEAERFVGREPGSGEGRAMMGIVLARRGENERALTFLEQALVLEPGMTRARIEKARILFDEGRYEEVLETLEEESSVAALYLVA
ncbi:MAG: tetratricopeptide repeat protein, partial [Vicinamibacteria bacterium]